MAVGPDLVKFLVDQILCDVSFYRDVFAAIGLLYVGKSVMNLTWSVYTGLRTHFFSRFLRPNVREKYGSWAIVTGCTEGIGRAYCIELAKHGFNIAMLSRNGEKMVQLAEFIGSRYKVEVIYQTVDFSKKVELNGRHISNLVNSIEPGILVNNVGVISRRPSYVVEMNEAEIRDHINVNVMTASIMTRMVLPRMLQRRKGAIINIASIAALSPAPLLAVYAGTKAYVQSFSQALHEEVRGYGITVQTLIPSYVGTRMVNYSDQLASSFMTPSPEVFVRSALRTLGRSDHTTGYWLHGMQAWILSCFPLFLRMRAAFYMNSYFRQAYLNNHKD